MLLSSSLTVLDLMCKLAGMTEKIHPEEPQIMLCSGQPNPAWEEKLRGPDTAVLCASDME